jgi:homoserine O-acetyltransferase
MTTATLRSAATALALLLAAHGAAAQTPAPEATPASGAQQFAELGDLKLRGGGVIRDFRIGYRTRGTLDAERSNAVLWPTWLGGRTQDQLNYVGPGKLVDSSKYFVILVDSIGDGVTTSPSNSKSQPLAAFPEFSLRDMVEAEYRLVTETLGLRRLHAVVGTSMGGMQAFEWAVAHPDALDAAVPMFGSPQPASPDRLWLTAQIDALKLDPAWKDGRSAGPMNRGFALAQEIDAMVSTTPEYRAAHTAPKDFAAFMSELAEDGKGDGKKAADQIRQRQAILAHDIPAEFGITLEEAAGRVRAKLLVVVAAQDHAVNPAPALAFAAALGAPTATIVSSCGHMSVHCVPLEPVVARFLDDPAAFRSVVLRDATAR